MCTAGDHIKAGGLGIGHLHSAGNLAGRDSINVVGAVCLELRLRNASFEVILAELAVTIVVVLINPAGSFLRRGDSRSLRGNDRLDNWETTARENAAAAMEIPRRILPLRVRMEAMNLDLSVGASFGLCLNSFWTLLCAMAR